MHLLKGRVGHKVWRIPADLGDGLWQLVIRFAQRGRQSEKWTFAGGVFRQVCFGLQVLNLISP